MKTIGNILWVLLCGFWMAVGWALCGVILAITIIGIPFAIQCFKLAQFTLWPFGYETVPSPGARTFGWLGNLLWFIPGLFLALGYAISGVLLCITIVGIPFGVQAFKFTGLALSPFGKEVVNTKRYRRRLAAEQRPVY